MITVRYRITNIENIYFLERKIGILPWRKLHVANNYDAAYFRLKVYTGHKRVVWEQP
jgi:hypothetical protein